MSKRIALRRLGALPLRVRIAFGVACGIVPLLSQGQTVPVLGWERVEEPLLIYDPVRHEVRNPRVDEPPAPMRVLLSKHRYWEQDRHLDIVVELNPAEAGERTQTRLTGRAREPSGREIADFEIDPVPGETFFFHPALPTGFTGDAVLELHWLRGEQILARHEEAFRVERFAPPAPSAGRIPITLPNPEGATARGLPVTLGIPFPRGILSDTAELRLLDEHGGEVPLQVTETARWSKYGSIKWVLCDFTIHLEGHPRGLFLEYGKREIVPAAADTRHATPAASLAADGRRWASRSVDTPHTAFPTIDTGRLRLGPDGLAFDARGDGAFVPVLDAAALSGAFVEHEDGRIYRPDSSTPFMVEEAGPEKLVIRREGWYVTGEAPLAVGSAQAEEVRNPSRVARHMPLAAVSDTRQATGDTRRFCRYVTRYVIHRDSSLVRIFHTWFFTGDGNRDRIANMGWRFSLDESVTPAGMLGSFAPEAEWERADSLLQYDYQHFDWLEGLNARPVEGGRAPGVARATGNGVTLFFGVKDFWQNYPSELALQDNALVFYNWPAHNPSAPDRFGPEAIEVPDWRLQAAQLRFAHEGEVLDFRLPAGFAGGSIWAEATGRGSGGENHWDEDEPESVNAQGISRTEEMWLYLAPEEPTDPVDASARTVLKGLNAETLRPVVDPAWVAASGAFGDIHYQDWERYPDDERTYEQVALAPSRWAERLGAYGMWIYGDVPAWNPRLSTRDPNLYRAYREGHHGWPYPWVAYARSGDPRLLKIVEGSTRQMIDAYYCHYVSDDVARTVGPNRFRLPGRWERSLLPWASRDGTSTRAYTSHSDHFWHAWYLTGYDRARELALLWGKHTREEIPGLRHRGAIVHDRSRYALGVSYLDMYEATFDAWFLVALHRVQEMNREAYRRGAPSRVDFWRPHARDFLRFTGCPSIAEQYLTMVNDPSRWHHLRGNGWGGTRGGGHPRIEPHAYAWRLTGDAFHLRRVAGILEYARVAVRDAEAPVHLQGWNVTGSQVQVTMWTPWYLRLFPAGLAVIHAADEKPPSLGHMFQLQSEPDGLTPRILLQKSESNPLPLYLSSRWTNEPMTYRLTGPDGEIVEAGQWDARRSLQLTVPAHAPPGVYTFQGTFARRGTLGVPLSEPHIPEVIALDAQAAMFRSGRKSRYYFKVPEGITHFDIRFDDFEARTVVRNPDGVHVLTLPNGALDSDTYQIPVPANQTDRLWSVATPTSGMAGRFRMDPRIPPFYATDAQRWFDPTR